MMKLNLLILIVATACLASKTTASAGATTRRIKGVKSSEMVELRALQEPIGGPKEKEAKKGEKGFEMQELKEAKDAAKAAKDAAILAAGGVLPHATGDVDGASHPPPPPPKKGEDGDAVEDLGAEEGEEVKAAEAGDAGSEPTAQEGEGEVDQQEADVAAAEAAQSGAAERQGSFALLVGAAVFAWGML